MFSSAIEVSSLVFDEHSAERAHPVHGEANDERDARQVSWSGLRNR